MKFLCDVHISYKIVHYLNSCGYDTIHINSVLDKWYTKDRDISEYADNHDYIIITKDADFRDSHYIKKSPKKLIKVNLGNISNTELIHILSEVISSAEKIKALPLFLIEIDKNFITYITGEEWR